MKILVKVEGAYSFERRLQALSFHHTVYRADVVCHWEDTDAVAQEMFANVSRLALA